MSDNTKYRGILQSTSLFGVVQIFNVLIKIILNKVVAVLLGVEAMGIISLFTNVLNLLKTAFGLGISQSGVKDISQAFHENDEKAFSKTISVTNKVILFTFILGIVGTILLSRYLSKLSFGDFGYTYSFVFLSIAVGFSILSEGQLTVLKGMRKLKEIAKSTFYGSIVGVIFAIPLYFVFGNNGIIPSLIITSFASFFFTFLYVRKIDVTLPKVSYKKSFTYGKKMIKMGVSLMFVSFVALLSEYIISSYISNYGSLKDLGLYQVGITILSSYFGIILVSITTDYYPRISAINRDNQAIENELNKQSEISLFLAFPLIVLFVFLSPILIPLMFSKEFIQVQSYTDIAILGTLITLCSNNMGMILLAKQEAKIFLITSLSQRVFMVVISIVSYKLWGLLGLGVTNIIMATIHLVIMSTIMKKKYRISWNRNAILSFLFILIIIIVAIISKNFQNYYIKYAVGFLLFLISIVYCYYFAKTKLGIDFQKLKNRITKK